MLSPSEKNQTSAIALKTVLFAFLAALFVYIVIELKVLIICLIFALTLASAMSPVAEWGQARNVPRLASVLFIYLLTLGIYVLLAISAIPTIREEAGQLYDNLPAYLDKAAVFVENAKGMPPDQNLGVNSRDANPQDANSSGKNASHVNSKDANPQITNSPDSNPSEEASSQNANSTQANSKDFTSELEKSNDAEQKKTSNDKDLALKGAAEPKETADKTLGSESSASGDMQSNIDSESPKTIHSETSEQVSKIEATSLAAKHLAKNFSVKTDDIQGFVSKMLSKTIDMTAGVVGLLGNVVLTLFLAAYFVVEAESLWPKILRWMPEPRRSKWAQLIRPLENRLGGYVRGQLLVSLCVAAFLFIGFTLLRLKYALILGVMAGLLNLVPFVGSLLATGSAILVALNQDTGGGPVLAGLVFLLYGIEQWVESSFIVPQLLGKSVDLHPLIVLFSILIGATLLGVAGALIAIPITSVGLLLCEEFYLKPMETRETTVEIENSELR